MNKYKVDIRADGIIARFIPGDPYRKLHCEDGPAIEYPDGTKKWYLDGKCHREDGPAAEYSYGDNHWYLEGRFLTEKEHRWMMSLNARLLAGHSAVEEEFKVKKLLCIL